MKEKILNQARLLYNAKGLSNVTARVICDHLKISLGSFSYHFPDKKNIIHGLYNAMVEEIQAVYNSIQHKQPTITTYLDSHKATFLIQEKYKFFYLNLFEILTNNMQIKTSFTKRRQQEISMAKQSLHHYMNAGVLKNNLSENDIKKLIDVAQILNNFWPIDSEISTQGNQTDRLVHYMKICCGLLEPYLEKESKTSYYEYFQSLEDKNQ